MLSVDIAQGVATIEHLLIDTERITIAGSGSISLVDETFDVVLAPQPKKASLVSLARPIRIEGPWANPNVSSVRLSSRRRMIKVGALAVINPAFLVASFSHTGQRDKNACVETVAEVNAQDATKADGA